MPLAGAIAAGTVWQADLAAGAHWITCIGVAIRGRSVVTLFPRQVLDGARFNATVYGG
jgi:hypothetical protein